MITRDDVRHLLEGDSDSVLVLVEGAHRGRRAGRPRHRRLPGGALQVITRAELVEQAGSEQLSDRELVEQAALLETAVAELGG